MKKLNHLLEMIDAQWIEENPAAAYELIEALIKEYYHLLDTIQIYRQKDMLSQSIIHKYIDDKYADYKQI